MKLYVVCTHRGDSNENTQHTIIVEKDRKYFPKLWPFASWTGAMISPQWLELSISRTNLHGPKDVRAIEVRLYLLFKSWRFSKNKKTTTKKNKKKQKKNGIAIMSLWIYTVCTLRKHAYSNKLKILPPKKWKFSDKKIRFFFHISAQNIDCGYSLEPPRRGGSNEYPRSMFLSRSKRIMYTPLNPSFTI